MGLEARVERLESHFEALDSAVRSLINITGDTHQEILATRQEMRTRFAQQDRELAGIKADVSALAEAMLAAFKRSDEQRGETQERINQLELLIRQSFPKN
ncbi:hypothetical protein [Endozoicomonas euniceicola]|uniref:Uncharacterized protein n=1 Tax=Endozoicomonas euniceicola TaxID=1234143 RepID=A0ABY6GT41_9GAMM|nr:hypothetical protein [Endozoicomonas euniceicola]UYM15281.1 hypothetical protein NX720_20860 [Endozoicomonas euniceicola]